MKDERCQGWSFFGAEVSFQKFKLKKKKKEWCLFSFFKKVCFISLQKYNHRITQKYLMIVVIPTTRHLKYQFNRKIINRSNQKVESPFYKILKETLLFWNTRNIPSTPTTSYFLKKKYHLEPEKKKSGPSFKKMKILLRER